MALEADGRRPVPLTFSSPVTFLLEALLGGGVCMEAADLVDSTVRGPSSSKFPLGLIARMRLAVSVSCSDSFRFRPLADSAPVFGSRRGLFKGVLSPNFWGVRRNSGLEAYGSEVSQVTLGSKKLDSSLGVWKAESSKTVVGGVLVGV